VTAEWRSGGRYGILGGGMTAENPQVHGEGSAVASLSREDADILASLREGVDAVVSGSFLFRSLDVASRHELAEGGVVMVFPAGRTVLAEGEPGSEFYLVDRGIVEVTTRTPAGVSVSLTTLQRGAFFGEVAMLTKMPRTATVTALTDVSVVRFDKADIERVLSRNPSAQRLLQTMIEGRAKDTFEKIARASEEPGPIPPDSR
jgi:CRP-like cAMP-binding protein